MESIAKKITQWIGTPASIILHTIFFTVMGLWFLLDASKRDHILLVLTTIVSLEAIYQMLFLQLTVNMQGETIEEMQETVEEFAEEHEQEIEKESK
jgi:hypothetical protein